MSNETCAECNGTCVPGESISISGVVHASGCSWTDFVSVSRGALAASAAEVAEMTRQRDAAITHDGCIMEDAYNRLEADIAASAARESALLRPSYPFRCDDCGGAHFFDTVIPSPVWNAICRNGTNEAELLCVLCIDKRLKAAGIEGTECEFYYAGEALLSKLYDARESELETKLAKAEHDVAFFTDQLDDAAGGMGFLGKDYVTRDELLARESELRKALAQQECLLADVMLLAFQQRVVMYQMRNRMHSEDRVHEYAWASYNPLTLHEDFVRLIPRDRADEFAQSHDAITATGTTEEER